VKAPALVIAITACGTTPATPPPAPWTSGTQLRAELYGAADGFATLAGRHDLATDLICYFVPADGKFAPCPPQVDSLYVEFSDAACTQPVFRMHPVPAPRYIQFDGTTYDVSEATVPMIYRHDNGPCVLDIANAPALVPIRAIPNDQVRPEHLVHVVAPTFAYDAYQSADGFSVVSGLDGASTTVIDDATTRLRNVFAESEGVRRLIGVHDTMFDRDCDVIGTANGIRCAPHGDAIGAISTYVDPTCQQLGLIANGNGLYVNGAAMYDCSGAIQTTYAHGPGPQHACMPVGAGTSCTDITDQMAALTETLD